MANEEQAAEPAMLLLKLLGEGSSAAARAVAPVLQGVIVKGGSLAGALTKELAKAGLSLGVKGAKHAMGHVVSMGDYGVVSASKLESMARERGANITEVTLPDSLSKPQLAELNNTLMKEKVACRVLSCDPPAIRCLEKDAGFVHRAASRIQDKAKIKQPAALCKCKHLAKKPARLKAKALPKPKMKMPSLKMK